MFMELDTRPLPEDIGQWEGQWVALADDGSVLGAWPTPAAMAPEVERLGLGDARLLYVRPPGEPCWSTYYWSRT